MDRGDRVERGTVVAACGNSGNSTEPHVHVQAMDRPGVWLAEGRPLLLDGRAPPPDGEVLSCRTVDASRTGVSPTRGPTG